jgi:hypothetical protein
MRSLSSSPSFKGITMQTSHKAVVLTALVAAVCILPLIASSAAVRRTAGVCVHIVWLYFVTGCRG